MNFMTPPIFDILNILTWKVKISIYLKALGMYVYHATAKKSYLDNDKYIEASTQALEALRHTLSKDIFLLFLIVIPLLQCGTH